MRRMTVVERRSGDVTILDLKGRLVFDEGDRVFRAHVDKLLAEGRTSIIVNLQEVTYVDSCGVGVLVAKYVSLRRLGGDLRFLHLTPKSLRLMEISKLVDIFRVYEDEAQAIASFTSEPAA
jgi:anti-sigma B factor antagonist